MFDSNTAEETVWGQKTANGVRAIAQEDGSILIVPVGSLEQHGNHLPTATDTILVNEIAHLGATRVEERVPVVVTPPIWTGYSPHHLSFGGTITLQLETMIHLLTDVATSALENGFDATLFVNGHGGNKNIVNAAVSELGTAQPSVDVHGVTYFDLVESAVAEIRESDLGGMAHGGEFETSLMLYLRPDLVDRERMDGTMLRRGLDHGTADMFSGGPLASYTDFETHSESGAIGDPAIATAEKGELLYNAVGDAVETLLNQIHEAAES